MKSKKEDNNNHKLPILIPKKEITKNQIFENK